MRVELGTSRAVRWDTRRAARPWLARGGALNAARLFVVALLVPLAGASGYAPLPPPFITIAGGYAIFITWLQIKLPLGPWGI